MCIIPILLLVSMPVLMSAASHPVVLRHFASRRRMLAQCGTLAVAAVTELVAVETAETASMLFIRVPGR